MRFLILSNDIIVMAVISDLVTRSIASHAFVPTTVQIFEATTHFPPRHAQQVSGSGTDTKLSMLVLTKSRINDSTVFFERVGV